MTPGQRPPPKPPITFTIPVNTTTIAKSTTTAKVAGFRDPDEVEKEEFYQNDEIEEDLFNDLVDEDFGRHKRSPQNSDEELIEDSDGNEENDPMEDFEQRLRELEENEDRREDVQDYVDGNQNSGKDDPSVVAFDKRLDELQANHGEEDFENDYDSGNNHLIADSSTELENRAEEFDTIHDVGGIVDNEDLVSFDDVMNTDTNTDIGNNYDALVPNNPTLAPTNPNSTNLYVPYSEKGNAIPVGYCPCGARPKNDKIGGEVNRPWMVHVRIMLETMETKECSGALINKRWVISAAHCFCKLSEVNKIHFNRI